jgi:hypothetical protein
MKGVASAARRGKVLVRVSHHYREREIFRVGLEFSDGNMLWQAPDSLTFCPNNRMCRFLRRLTFSLISYLLFANHIPVDRLGT